jgi:hypothetical protein
MEFFQSIFFHKYSLVGCQQNLVVFIFFDYSGLFNVGNKAKKIEKMVKNEYFPIFL